MNKFLKTLSLFSIPFILVFILVLLIDPYDYFGLSVCKNNRVKVECARKVDYSRRQNLINYARSPKPNVIIGTSQTRRILVENLPSGNWAQLSMGGAGISDELDMFWHIASKYDIDSLIIGFDPWNYAISTGYNSSDVTETAFKMMDNPVRYFFDKIVYKAGFEYVKTWFSKDVEITEKPDETKDVFWQKELNYVRKCMSNPSYNPEVRKRLEEMRNYCKEKDITLTVIVPVSHTDVYDITKEYYDTYFINELVDIFGTVYDFMSPNSYNTDKSHFGDPCHMIGDSIYIDVLFKGGTDNYKLNIKQ